jgi:hypothetical protein
VEIVVTLSIIVILASILIAAINPNAILKRSRDVTRVQDLDTIDKAIQVMKIEISNFDELNYASQNIVYISLKDSSTTCGSYINELPSLPSGWQYRCSNSPTNIDGTGWIPFPFNQVPLLTLSKLPVDPINKPPYYYAFIVGGSFSLFTMLEDTQRTPNSKNDGDNFPHLYSTVNSNKNLINQAQGLVGYWSFDEGSGTTARDLSGFGNNLTIDGLSNNYVSWSSAGKVNNAIQYNSCPGYNLANAGAYVNISSGNIIYNLPQSNFTFLVWAKRIDPNVDGGTNLTIFHFYTQYYIAGCCSGFWNTSGIANNSGVNTPLSFFGFPDLNRWYFYGYVFNLSNLKHKQYVDGKLYNEATNLSGSYGNISKVILGAYDNNCWHFTHFVIDEARLYNRALSDSEIKALYDATK